MRRLAGAAVVGLAVAAAALCAACADGYPSEDVPPLNASALDRAGLLQALHDLAEQPDLRPRRSYRLHAGCVLEVTVHARVGAQQRASAALPASQVELRFDNERRRYDVLLRASQAAPTEAPEAAPVDASPGPEVLAGARWVDAVSARSVLRHLQADCVSPRTGAP
jgi:hypothetical protein